VKQILKLKALKQIYFLER